MDHSHAVSPTGDRRRVLAALAVVVAFMGAEVVAGALAHSLALLSDAAHQLTDAGALALALIAMRLAARRPGGALTYGLKRAEVLSALANGIALFVLAALIVLEGIGRLLEAGAVDARWMLVLAVAGLPITALSTTLLHSAERQSLNVRGALQHMLNDLYALAATAVAAVAIMLTGFTRADSAASLLIAALMVLAGWRLVRDATRVLLEAAPAGMPAAEIGATLASFPSVLDVHDFHVWEITTDLPALSAHVIVQPDADCHGIRLEMERLLQERFGLHHTTLQVDHASEEPGLIQVQPHRARAK
jgi:cobalt-zinc-cadmium efflux system protein